MAHAIWSGWKGTPSLLISGILLFILAQFTPTLAYANKVKQRTEVRDYRVYGKTAGQIVSYMKRWPFRGDNGPAMANIRPRYSLKTTTAKAKQGCKVKKVDLTIKFIMTLPKSMDARKHSRNTKNAWRSFRAFAKRHEEQHRRIYMKCARDFVRAATRVKPMRTCSGVTRAVKKMLKTHEKACDKKHLAFDRREFPRVPALPLFRQARFEKQKARRTHKSSKNKKQSTWFGAN